METTIRPSKKAMTLATAVSVAGLGLASVSVMYIAGMFGLSSALASQIVNAVEVGGIALAIVMGVLSGGVAAGVIATARWAIFQFGKRAAVA
ncbi:uberolysin/carnocyclin family circular bacteriocin [Arthrobacter sp. MI7-26]|uniref:uberolysin/carnocyclin family circular bacteriocin n=1 Tax=Arthrobacter sp. MI7-26 TaxID=2993653 RepID=UPI0022488916|nr:uberolysin/carnocyclin family circular bacteriocin [Arthrobacter sp. MI7-26]MCX2747730.1 uberolysin/carnocyclin family circular bacteriocin [Arthrobacter sp. MI7-26]